MNVQAPFGFVTGCHAGDKFMVQATLASMRHYCPRVPICLVVDGRFDVSDLERDYHLVTLRVPELPSVEMRELICGNYRAKLAAMWEGPFGFYVWLDSDAIVWGDFTSQIRTDVDFQIFGNDVSIPTDATSAPPWLSHLFFDTEKLLSIDPRFEWRGHAYFCSGAFACRRNAIAFAEWAKIESLARPMPGLFAWGEMGILNYIVHAMSQRGQIKSVTTDLQHVWGHHGKAELVNDCIGNGWQFPKVIRRPRVAHFCGRKPFLFDRKAYSRPFTIARLEHHRRHHDELGSWLAVLNEDRTILVQKIRNRIRRLASRLKVRTPP